MAITITATPRPTRGASVLLQLAGAATGAAVITRTDANGTRTVRLLPGQEVIGGALEVDDYEAALTGTIRYDVKDKAGAVATTSTSLQPYGPYAAHLLIPVSPQNRIDVVPIVDDSHDRQAQTSLHEVIGRADKIPTVMGSLRLREGPLLMEPSTYPACRQVEAMVASGDTVMLRQDAHPGLDMYFVVVKSHIEPERQTRSDTNASGVRTVWRLSFDYVEVTAPVAPLSGAVGWTYAASKTYSGTYVQSSADFRLYSDLFIGPP